MLLRNCSWHSRCHQLKRRDLAGQRQIADAAGAQFRMLGRLRRHRADGASSARIWDRSATRTRMPHAAVEAAPPARHPPAPARCGACTMALRSDHEKSQLLAQGADAPDIVPAVHQISSSASSGAPISPAMRSRSSSRAAVGSQCDQRGPIDAVGRQCWQLVPGAQEHRLRHAARAGDATSPRP